MKQAWIISAGALILIMLVVLPGRAPHNMVIFAFDGAEARHLAAYGYATTTAPALEQFFKESYVFTNTVSTTSTEPAFYSLLTSGTTTLASLLKNHGYSTAAFTGGGTFLNSEELRKGFDTYYAPESEGNYSGAVPRALEWIARHPRDQPFFVFVHGYDLARVVPEAHTGALVTRTDAEFGSFMRGLFSQGLLEKTVILVVSHDESGTSLLALRTPIAAHRRIDVPISPTDFVPMLLPLLPVYSTSTPVGTDRILDL